MFVYAKPSSFYERLFPCNFIDIFLTATAIHWLPGKAPTAIEEFMFSTYNVTDTKETY